MPYFDRKENKKAPSMQNNLITCEDDVRAWVRSASGGKARWVEPALGSTPGLPDCWVPWGEYQVHLELKAATLVSVKGKSILRYEVRPEQRREIRVGLMDRVRIGLLIGVKGTNACVFALPSDHALAGQIVLSNKLDQRRTRVMDNRSGQFWDGVEFVSTKCFAC